VILILFGKSEIVENVVAVTLKEAAGNMFANRQVQFRGFEGENSLTVQAIFSGLNTAALSRFLSLSKPVRFEKGLFVLATNKIPPGIFVLTSGRAIVFDDSVFGEDINLRLAFANEVFGLTETVARIRSSVNVETISDCFFRYLGRRELLRFLADERTVCFRVVRLLGERERRMVQCGNRKLRNRIGKSATSF
jgi:CRP-like cAMP-binding protein